jgi:hypothetical protein
MRRVVDRAHLGRVAILKREWEGQNRGIVMGWYSDGFRLLMNEKVLDFAFGEVLRIEGVEEQQ